MQLLAVELRARASRRAAWSRSRFAGGGDLRVEVECIDAALADLSAPWPTPQHARRTMPREPLSSRRLDLAPCAASTRRPRLRGRLRRLPGRAPRLARRRGRARCAGIIERGARRGRSRRCCDFAARVRPGRADRGHPARHARRRSTAGAAPVRPRCATPSPSPPRRIRAYHERQRPADAALHRRGGRRARLALDAAGRRGHLCAGRPGRLSLDGADERRAGPRRRRGPHRHGHAARRAGAGGAGRGQGGRRHRDLARRRRAGRARRWPTAPGRSAPVDKIVGPGNAYVTAAKRRLYGMVGIDALAGPSEIVVVADGANDPAWIAADLLSQAEHDPDAQSILITDDAAFADAVVAAVEASLTTAGHRRGRRAPPGATTARWSSRPLDRPPAWSTASRPSTWSSPSTSPSGWPTGCATPARSSSAATRPRRSATMWPAPTTSCRPAARRGSLPACRSTTSSSAPRS